MYETDGGKMKVDLAEGLKILQTSYRELASECNMTYTAVYHLTQRKYSPRAVSRLKVEAALNLMKNYEVDKCMRQIDALKRRIELLSGLEIDF
jgi:SMC interacting uncharacterized protein involved in chromosome segregation